jgi:hypothetical protein
VDVDPRHWRSRADVAANVALGIGNSEQQLQKLMIIADKQEQNLLAGSPLVTPGNLHHTYEKIIDVSGFKNAGAFFTDPATVEPTPPPPDPEMVKIQGQLELQKQDNEAKARLREQDAFFDRQNKADEIMLQRDKMSNEMNLAGIKMRAEMDKLEQDGREKDKKIDLMDAQIAQIYAEIGLKRDELRLDEEKAVVDTALRAKDGTLAERGADREDFKARHEVDHKGKELEHKGREHESGDRHKDEDRKLKTREIDEGGAERKAKVGLTEAQAHATRNPPKDEKSEKDDKPAGKRRMNVKVAGRDKNGRATGFNIEQED